MDHPKKFLISRKIYFKKYHRIWLHLMKKSLMEDFIFWTVRNVIFHKIISTNKNEKLMKANENLSWICENMIFRYHYRGKPKVQRYNSKILYKRNMHETMILTLRKIMPEKVWLLINIFIVVTSSNLGSTYLHEIGLCHRCFWWEYSENLICEMYF